MTETRPHLSLCNNRFYLLMTKIITVADGEVWSPFSLLRGLYTLAPQLCQWAWDRIIRYFIRDRSPSLREVKEPAPCHTVTKWKSLECRRVGVSSVTCLRGGG